MRWMFLSVPAWEAFGAVHALSWCASRVALTLSAPFSPEFRAPPIRPSADQSISHPPAN
jgi:hypothetical protein